MNNDEIKFFTVFLSLIGYEGNEIEMGSVVCLSTDTNNLKKCCVGGFCPNIGVTGSSVDSGTHTHGRLTGLDFLIVCMYVYICIHIYVCVCVCVYRV